MIKEKIVILTLFAAVSLLFSSCCGLECRAKGQKAENQYVINAEMDNAVNAVKNMMEKAGYKVFVEKSADNGAATTVVEGALSANQTQGSKFVSSVVRKFFTEVKDQPVDRIEIKRTITIKQRLDETNGSIIAGKLGVTNKYEIYETNSKGEIISTRIKDNEETDRAQTGRDLQEIINESGEKLNNNIEASGGKE